MAAHKLESELGVDQRFTADLDRKSHGRHVPTEARDKNYNAVPASLDTIHARTDVPIRIFNREGQKLYDSPSDARAPGVALNEAREARVRGPKVTRAERGLAGTARCSARRATHKRAYHGAIEMEVAR